MKRISALWVCVGLFGYTLLPWYMIKRHFWDKLGPGMFSDPDAAPGLIQALAFDRLWLAAPGLALAAAALTLLLRDPVRFGRWSAIAGFAGIFLTFAQGLAIGLHGPRLLPQIFGIGAMAQGQNGFGVGAFLTLLGLLFVTTTGISATGKGRGDAFVTGLIGLIIALVAIFVFYPVLHILV
ncbi:MAG TPA: iron ABC transporter permease, partial [Aliiroseovarius sp.]|nr:iron ABC transporter permease [Aliiroseovarius sp.]